MVLTRFPSKSNTSTSFAVRPETNTWPLASSTAIALKPIAPSATDVPVAPNADDPVISAVAAISAIALANLPGVVHIGDPPWSAAANLGLNVTVLPGRFIRLIGAGWL